MRALTQWMPLDPFRREMDRFFDRFVTPRWDEFEVTGEWWPRMDLVETKDAVMVKADVPGVDEKDIHVSLQADTLTIKGEKHHEKEEKDAQFHRTERAYGAFTRSFRLPVPVDASRVTAEFKGGVLTVTMPKTLAAKGTTIPVKAA